MTCDTPRRDSPAVSVVALIADWSFLARSPGRSCCPVRRGGWYSAALRAISLGWHGRPTHPSDGGYSCCSPPPGAGPCQCRRRGGL